MPGSVLWYRTFYPGDFTTRVWEDGIREGWMDPPDDYFFPADTVCWQYNFFIDEAEAFHQEGTPDRPVIYWLDVQAFPGDEQARWGWKTSVDHWNDNAVWAQGSEPYVGSWQELRYPPGHELYEQPIDLAFVITGGHTQDELDWGDAPDGAAAPGYPTLSWNNGANHVIVSSGPWLGDLTDSPDPEADGQPDANALGDDTYDFNDDEDGVTIPILTQGQTDTVYFSVSNGPAYVFGWIDFNGDQIWQHPAEQVYYNYLAGGNYSFAVTAPNSSVVGQTFARFRISTVDSLLPDGPASDGEVEDYEVYIEEEQQTYKWLQRPDLFPTGIDVAASYDYILADDFLCTEHGWVVGIKVWGSWLDDQLPFGDLPERVKFTLSFHEDIPESLSPTGYSMPGDVLWYRDFLPGDFTAEVFASNIDEGWLDPPAYYLFPADHVCWLYRFHVDPSEAFIQLGTEDNPEVYWLDLKAVPLDSLSWFGWKTSLDHWNDDAVWGLGAEPYLGPWGRLVYPPNHEFHGRSIDLAFEIITEGATGTTESEPAPETGGLLRNVPNPFNPTTSIEYQLAAPGHVKLEIFDVSGSLVRTLVDEPKDEGRHGAVWRGRDDQGRELSSGVYFYRLSVDGIGTTSKMVFMK
jgi:hypothetical protein